MGSSAYILTAKRPDGNPFWTSSLKSLSPDLINISFQTVSDRVILLSSSSITIPILALFSFTKIIPPGFRPFLHLLKNVIKWSRGILDVNIYKCQI